MSMASVTTTPQLYVLIYPDAKGGVVWQLIDLPDQTKLRAISPYNNVAQLDVTLAFSNGTLVSTSEQIDTTAVPRAAIQALAKIIPNAIAALLAQAQPGAKGAVSYSLPSVQLYKVTMSHGVVEPKAAVQATSE